MQIKPYVLLHLELFRSVFLWLTCVGSLMTNSVVEQILYIYLVGVLNCFCSSRCQTYLQETPLNVIYLRYLDIFSKFC